MRRRPRAASRSGRRPPVRGWALRIALTLSLLFTATGCGRLFFFPDGALRVLPSQLGLDYEDVFVASGGERLHGWFLPARGVEGRGPGVLFLHGNAENVSSHIASVYWLPAQGFSVLLVDYRGYGNSTGKPTLAGVHEDAAAALRALSVRPEIDPAQLVVLGQSLGGSIAVATVESMQDEVPVRVLVLDSAFSGYRRIARDKLSEVWLTWPLQWPLSFLFPDSPKPERSLAQLGARADAPWILLLHGDADRVVPVAHARRLRKVAPPEAGYWEIPGVDHIAALQDEHWQRQLAAVLREALAL